MSELVTTLRQAVAELAAADRSHRRFGAAAHRYELDPPSPEAVALIESTLGVTLPDEYRDFVADVSAGGAGPAYGVLPADRIADHAIRESHPAWTLAIPVAHFGCGYATILPLDGRARGEVWLYAKSIGLVGRSHATFSSYYVDWIDRLARNVLPEPYVAPDACALPAALSGYLGVWERRLGVEAGKLSGPTLREALGGLAPGAIELASEASSPLFDAGDRVDPCLSCAILVENLVADGLAPDVVAPGVRPRLVR